MRKTPSAAVIGAGPSGLMAAERLARGGVAVRVYDRMPSIGRKLLMAGLSGLNLTHTEPAASFLARYGEAAPRLREALDRFSPDALRSWCTELGQDTFVGSSGRVFPAAMKASPLLRAWRARLDALGVTFGLRHRWTGWALDGQLEFATPDGPVSAAPDATVLALGGATWARLGSDGRWAGVLSDAGFAVAPFAPANCAVAVPWSPVFLERFEGLPLKNIGLRIAGDRSRGELVVTRTGLEGGALYLVGRALRTALAAGGDGTEMRVALRPDLGPTDLAGRLARRRSKDSLATALRRLLHLAPVAIGLLQEAARQDGVRLSDLGPAQLAARINDLPVRVTGLAPLDRAISAAGGLRFAECDAGGMLLRRPGTFAAGEMLDWEAPTGGYLLQGCFATGYGAGEAALDWLRRTGRLTAG